MWQSVASVLLRDLTYHELWNGPADKPWIDQPDAQIDEGASVRLIRLDARTIQSGACAPKAHIYLTRFRSNRLAR